MKHLKVWNKWRKKNKNGKIHKILVLIGIRKSPTFEMEKAFYGVDFRKAFEEGIKNGEKKITGH